MRPRLASSYSIVVALIGAAASASAQQQPPAAGPPRDFTVPARQDVTLTSGMPVSLVRYGSVPLVSVRLVICGGSVNEGPNEVWLSKLVGDYLTEGTDTRSAAAIALAAGGMGGTISVEAGNNQIAVGATVLADSAAAFISLLADVAEHPTFPDSELPRLRADRLRALAIAHSQPNPLARARFDAQLFPDSPYGRDYPTADQFTSYTRAQVREFYVNHLRSANAHLYVVGQFNASAVDRQARAGFGDWQTSGACKLVNAVGHKEHVVSLIDRPGAVQSTIILGLPVAPPTSPDWIPLQTADALLGGAFMSRITLNIREQKGYTYSPYSALIARPGEASWSEEADVTTNVTGASLKEIFGEIDRLRREAPSAAEVKGIQSYMAGLFTLGMADQNVLWRQLAFVDAYGLGDTYLSQYVHHVYEVTPADVQRMANQYFDPSAMAIVVAGDRATVASQLAPYGPPVQ